MHLYWLLLEDWHIQEPLTIIYNGFWQLVRTSSLYQIIWLYWKRYVIIVPFYFCIVSPNDNTILSQNEHSMLVTVSDWFLAHFVGMSWYVSSFIIGDIYLNEYILTEHLIFVYCHFTPCQLHLSIIDWRWSVISSTKWMHCWVSNNHTVCVHVLCEYKKLHKRTAGIYELHSNHGLHQYGPIYSHCSHVITSKNVFQLNPMMIIFF